MLQADAIRIMARLTAAFPQIALEEEQAEVLLRELVILHEARFLDMAVTQIIQRDERFPSIARIRGAYKTLNELEASSRAALERGVPFAKSDIPEWVHVWEWRRKETQGRRQAANEAYGHMKVGERPPARMRLFPQEAEKGPNTYTLDEYEGLREAWVKAGAPKVGSASELLASVTAEVPA